MSNLILKVVKIILTALMSIVFNDVQSQSLNDIDWESQLKVNQNKNMLSTFKVDKNLKIHFTNVSIENDKKSINKK